jgi:hypothetical protein
MAETVSITYSDVVITYDERADVWRFELRGRDRHAESLLKAKEAIDKPAPEPKGKPFERFKAYIGDYGNTFTEIEVLSVAADGYRGLELWVNSKRGRRKEKAGDIYPITPENTAAVQRIAELSEQVKTLESHIRVTRLNMKSVDEKALEEQTA